MLKLNPDPHFKAEVKITVPGKLEPETVNLTFKYRNRTDLVALWKKSEKPVSTDIDITKEQLELFNKIVTGWDGVDGEFNAKNVETFVNNYSAAVNEIIAAYGSLCLESRVKN
jgi:hypothetical protein